MQRMSLGRVGARGTVYLNGEKMGDRALTPGYLMIYAPRNEEEVKTTGKTSRAGVAYTSGGMEPSFISTATNCNVLS